MDLKKRFLDECGVDLNDYEYAGKFPSKNKHGVWGNIPRGEGWKRYSEWLETLVKESDSLPCVSESKSFDIHNCINEVCDAVHARFHLYGQTAKGDGSFRWRVKRAIDKMLYSR